MNMIKWHGPRGLVLVLGVYRFIYSMYVTVRLYVVMV